MFAVFFIAEKTQPTALLNSLQLHLLKQAASCMMFSNPYRLIIQWLECKSFPIGVTTYEFQ